MSFFTLILWLGFIVFLMVLKERGQQWFLIGAIAFINIASVVLFFTWHG